MDARRTIARLLESAAAHEAAGDLASAEREYRRAIRRLKASGSTPQHLLRQRARALIGLRFNLSSKRWLTCLPIRQ